MSIKHFGLFYQNDGVIFVSRDLSETGTPNNLLNILETVKDEAEKMLKMQASY